MDLCKDCPLYGNVNTYFMTNDCDVHQSWWGQQMMKFVGG